MRIRVFIAFLVFAVLTSLVFACSQNDTFAGSAESAKMPAVSPTPKGLEKNSGVVFVTDWDGTTIDRTDEEWKKHLTDFEYYVLREKGTEQPYTGSLTKNKAAGTYHCAA